MSDCLLHLVFGGKVKDSSGVEFTDAEELDVVGIYPSYELARNAWKGASQAKVDDALTKYVVVHLHRMLEPDEKTD